MALLSHIFAQIPCYGWKGLDSLSNIDNHALTRNHSPLPKSGIYYIASWGQFTVTDALMLTRPQLYASIRRTICQTCPENPNTIKPSIITDGLIHTSFKRHPSSTMIRRQARLSLAAPPNSPDSYNREVGLLVTPGLSIPRRTSSHINRQQQRSMASSGGVSRSEDEEKGLAVLLQSTEATKPLPPMTESREQGLHINQTSQSLPSIAMFATPGCVTNTSGAGTTLFPSSTISAPSSVSSTTHASSTLSSTHTTNSSMSAAPPPKHVYGLPFADLVNTLNELGINGSERVASRLFSSVYGRGVTHLSEVGGLGKMARERLEGVLDLSPQPVISVKRSTDETRKWLLKVGKEQVVETVFIPNPDTPSLFDAHLPTEREASYAKRIDASGSEGEVGISHVDSGKKVLKLSGSLCVSSQIGCSLRYVRLVLNNMGPHIEPPTPPTLSHSRLPTLAFLLWSILHPFPTTLLCLWTFLTLLGAHSVALVLCLNPIFAI